MAHAITGGLNVGLSRYNDSWKALRKAAQVLLTPQAVKKHLPIQQAEATQLMYDIVNFPQVLTLLHSAGKWLNVVCHRIFTTTSDGIPIL